VVFTSTPGFTTIGDYALALGNPFLLAEDFTPTVTLGIISGLHRYQAGAGKKGRALRYTDCIQVDTSINPGNSGGPLFDLSGRLVGINGRVSIEERGRVNVGVGYAITINQIKRFIPMLRAGLAAKHATAGFTTTDRRGAVVVDQILDDAPAYLAGLRLGDHILRFGGRAITSANQFKSILDVYPAGWTVEVVFRRPPAADEKNGAAAHPQESRRIRFRLGDLPFPEMSGGHGGMFGAKNPFGPHPVTRAANRRAVRRALERYHHALGGAAAVARLKTIRMTGRRVLARAPAAPPTPIHSTETRASALTPANGRTPVAIERAIRWMLLAPAEKAARDRYRVVGADEVRRRIAVLIKRKATEGCPDFRLAFDDADGRLLSMEFTDPMTGKRARYEYDDYRRAGGLKLPHLRRLYLDDAPYATDRFERITASG
ncbi:MAG: S1C family serine protease, partial [Phycisphaerae bacterium]